MTKFFTEAEEDMNMDVQVGPQEEIEAEIEPCNAVDQAKMDPATVVVAAVEKNEGCCKKEACGQKEGCCKKEACGAKKEEACGQKEGCGKCEKCCREFYVDAKDVEKYAELTEQSMLEALNDIIAANEEAGMAADNLVVVMSEGTMGYTRNLEAHGAVCMFAEAADINVDVQVGPNEEEISVQEDPQTANPLDVVKKDYDTVVVAQKGDEFFMDVEDVQKCADLNCESVIKTLNGIIAANEEAGICADNVRVIVSEDIDFAMVNTLEEAGVILEAKYRFLPKFQREPEMKKYLDDLQEAEDLLSAKNIDPKTGVHKVGRIALRILSIYENIESIVSLPLCLTIVGIPVHLIVRGWVWAFDAGEESVALAQGKKVLAKYDVLIGEEKDPKVKAKLQECRDKVAKSMEEFDAKRK